MPPTPPPFDPSQPFSLADAPAFDPSAPFEAASSDSGWRAAAGIGPLLPIEVKDSSTGPDGAKIPGDVRMSVPPIIKGIPGALKEAWQDISAPGDILSGKRPMTPEQMGDASRGIVGMTVGTPAVAPAVGKGAALAVDAAKAMPKIPAPTRIAIKAASQEAYKAAEEKGGVVTSADFSHFANRVGTEISKDFNKRLHPGVNNVMASLDDLAGKDVTLTELEQYRRQLGKAETTAYKQKDADTARIISTVSDEVDGLIEKMPGGPEIERARALWRKNAQMHDIEEIEKTAKVLGSKGSPHIQRKFESILKNPNKLAQYTPEQQKIIQKIANTGWFEGAARLLAPSTGWAGLAHGSAGAILGFGAAGPVGAFAVPGAAMAVKGAGNAVRGARLGALSDDIARGGAAAPDYMDRFKAQRAERSAGVAPEDGGVTLGSGGFKSGPYSGMSRYDAMERQGGTLASKPGIDKLTRALDEHGMEWQYHPSGNGITAYSEVVGPGGKVFKEGKHFNEKTSLRTLRDWLGY